METLKTVKLATAREGWQKKQKIENSKLCIKDM